MSTESDHDSGADSTPPGERLSASPAGDTGQPAKPTTGRATALVGSDGICGASLRPAADCEGDHEHVTSFERQSLTGVVSPPDPPKVPLDPPHEPVARDRLLDGWATLHPKPDHAAVPYTDPLPGEQP